MPSIIKFCKRNNEMISLAINCYNHMRKGKFPTYDCVSIEDLRRKQDAKVCVHMEKEGCLIGELVDLEEYYKDEKNTE